MSEDGTRYYSSEPEKEELKKITIERKLLPERPPTYIEIRPLQEPPAGDRTHTDRTRVYRLSI